MSRWPPSVLVVASLAASGAPPLAQVSPGPLSRAHRGLEGNLRCLECHGSGRGRMDAQCLACHREIGWLVERDRGLHAREGAGTCASCHPEHAGRDFDLTGWPAAGPAGFDHGRTGWPLAGKHAALDCSACHQARLQVSPAASLAREVGGSRRWVGLDPACQGCHEDIHRGALGSDCARCHGTADWRVPAFDHDRTDFRLLGKHRDVPCDKCHRRTGLALPVDSRGVARPLFKPLPHAECSACHADPHVGRLGAACGRCHRSESFRQVSREAFDHDRTRYPLRGAHREVPCASCHDPAKAGGARPPFGTCGACHRDPHAGRATLAGRTVDCAACHDLQAFRPSTFNAARHAESAYPLEGRHAQARCEGCHRRDATPAGRAVLGPAGVELRPKHARCADCHRDAHAAQLASRPDGGACEGCHRPAGWRPSLFTPSQHAALPLALDGRHAEVPCGACHDRTRPGLPALAPAAAGGEAKVLLLGVGVACEDCHRDPHARSGAEVEGRPRRRCQECHDTRSFRPSKVDAVLHRGFGLPLEGAHLAVPCASCHREMEARGRGGPSLVLAAATGPALPFTDRRRRCAECHSGPHGEQFASRPDGGACESCHGVETFRPATRFDHDRDSRFSLRGAHARVPCERCHPRGAEVDGRAIVVYRPTPARCESCHRRAPGEPA